MNPYLKALQLRYESEIEIIQLNLKNYLDNSVAVAEHPDIVQDIDDLVAALSTAQEKLNTVQGMN
jgi:uncharacterized protein YaeQ|tara:strand:- start:121 stop:315 length:195 start_codon:yes stop_codon:yes gene_type:complete